MITLPVPPSANRLWRSGRGHTYLAPEYRTWARKAGLALRQQWKARPISGNVRVHVSWYRTRKQGDLDNKIKPVLDLLRGVVIKDDRQVTSIHAFRLEATQDPRVEVEVWLA